MVILNYKCREEREFLSLQELYAFRIFSHESPQEYFQFLIALLKKFRSHAQKYTQGFSNPAHEQILLLVPLRKIKTTR
jgi:hypothetical protein